MANEYLTRTPTSTGNRKVFTISFWTKNNVAGGHYFQQREDANSTTQFNISHRTPEDYLRVITNDGGSVESLNDCTALMRDFSNWQNIIVAVNTTIALAEDRVKIYVDGVRRNEFNSDSHPDNPAQNFLTSVNDTVRALIGIQRPNSSATLNGSVTAQLTDYFLIDGQALTPDVFGFYKDGKGYQSSGTTQVTDFRPGQWSPHSPRKIKTEIERKGGFGVNGFYLPMNDSSNFGADFHTTPNSIIKLKGEDLPQPRNGAPTTSDAFVSQLRQETGSLGFDGCVNFDGNGDYLSIPSSSDFALGTGNWTIEYFAYPTSTAQYQRHFYLIGSSANNIEGIFADGNGISFGRTNVWAPSQVSHPLYRWNHYALVHDSTNMRLYINGNQVLTSTDNFVDENKSLVIGHSNSTFGGYFTGFMSNFRVVKGTALYTSNFTPPTESLTNVTNTKLLCCNSSTSASASTVTPGTIATNGDLFATRNELTGSIVLAVPGVELENTNPELVTNGDFSNGTTGWTGLSGGSLSVEDGKLKITETTNALDAYAVNSTAITTVVGRRYTIKWTFHEGTNTTFTVRFGNSGNQSQEYQSNTGANGYGSYPDPGTYSFTFTATATTLNLSFIVNQASSYGYVSNVSVKEAVAVRDYSADIKGSGTNKTLTGVTLAGVYPVSSYYGSAMQFGNDGTNGSGNTDVINVPDSSDFYFTGDVTMECWIYPNGTPSTASCIMGQWQSGGGTDRNFQVNFDTSNRVIAYFNSSATNYNTGTSSALSLDQWHHIAVEKYGSIMTLYVNGVAVGVNNNTPTAGNNSTVPFTIGSETDGSNGADYGFNGYIQDVRVYKGVAKYKGGFNVPKPYTPVGIESWRQVPDTCKNNFATLNSIDYNSSTTALSDGNLTMNATSNNGSVYSATYNVPNSGKYYFEFYEKVIDVTTTNYISIVSASDDSKYQQYRGYGYIYTDGVQATGYATMDEGDLIGVGIDADLGKVSFYNNGTLVATVTSSSADYVRDAKIRSYLPRGAGSYPPGDTRVFNFGQNPTFSGTLTAGTHTDANGKGLFKYQPPAGFLALCQDNLPTPAIADPGKHFKTVLWRGDGNNGHSITGVGFQPDLVWLKERTNTSSHQWHDSVRGAGNVLFSNATNAESYSATYLYSLDSDGFTLGTSGGVNASTDDYVAWCWKAGGAAVSNTDGALTSQVSVNQAAGFSIASYTTPGTATNFGHGLGKKPAFALFKAKNDTGNWAVYHQSLGTNTIRLSTTDAQDTSADAFNGTAPTDTLMYLGTWAGTNNPNINWVSYLWSEIEGFSKFGSYTGNGNADGPFVYCGFKPAWIMIKPYGSPSDSCYSGGYTSWSIYDSSRSPVNNATMHERVLFANRNYAEGKRGNGASSGAFQNLDFVSNGFKIRGNSNCETNTTSINGFIFAAFAESPFQTANAK